MIERRIFTLWTGDNPMSPARQRALATLREKSGVEVVLVTPENLAEWVVDGHPLHPAYELLSLTHRSDYLRAYLMYHWGGGYADLKPFDFDWNPYFNDLESSQCDFIGSRERSPRDIAVPELRHRYSELVGMQRFIYVPRCTFAQHWLRQVELRLSKGHSALRVRDGSYHPRAVSGLTLRPQWLFAGISIYSPGIFGYLRIRPSPRGYPFAWTELLGVIHHALQGTRGGSYLLHLPGHRSPGRYR